jgi:hypothetical protein
MLLLAFMFIKASEAGIAKRLFYAMVTIANWQFWEKLHDIF